MLQYLYQLFYPQVCCSCGESISKAEHQLCFKCYENLAFCPYASWHIHPIEKIFWGRCVVHAATSLLVFGKHGVGQQLLHRLKYKGDEEIGNYMGQLLGERLTGNSYFKDVEALVPVPLNDKKLKLRGYNQSAVISKGVAEVLGIPVIENYLVRIRNNSSQTKKGRLERVENISGSFALNDRRDPKVNRILVIDDVITTGSTLEACINLLAPKHQVSVATLAYQ